MAPHGAVAARATVIPLLLMSRSRAGQRNAARPCQVFGYLLAGSIRQRPRPCVATSR